MRISTDLARASSGAARSIHYLHDEQKRRVEALRASWLWRTQLPTWLVIASIYGGWFGVLSHAEQLGKPLTAVLLVLLLTWYMSLQHELMHGHPTRWSGVNWLLGMAPLAIWFPYGLYRDSHRAHHRNEQITCPERDPESYFVSMSHWESCGGLRRVLLRFRNTIAGRLLIGPIFSVAGAVRDEWRRMTRGEVRIIGRWLLHIVLVVVLLSWIERNSGLSPLFYLFAIAYPALALALVRSFHEHRPATRPEQRSVLNDAGWFWRLLFLNNNYHLVHHDLPDVPWYGLRKLYLEDRARYDERSGGYCIAGYSDWLRRHAFSPVEHPVHGLDHEHR